MLEHETLKTLLSELSSGEWHDLDEVLRRCGRSDVVREALTLLVSEGVVQTEGTRSPRYRLREDFTSCFTQWETDGRAQHERFRTLLEEERRIRDLVLRVRKRDPDAVRDVLDEAYKLLRDGLDERAYASFSRDDERVLGEALSDAL